MKQGIYKGYNAGCCDGLEIWGVSSNSPNVMGNYYTPSTSEIGAITYDLESHAELRPELWSRAVNSVWPLYAAMVPGTYPGPAGESENRPTSSKATGEWFVEIGITGRHKQVGSGEFATHTIESITKCYGTRAIYVDGQQTWVTYKLTGQQTFDSPIIGERLANLSSGMGDHHILNIANQEVEASYLVQYLNGVGFVNDLVNYPFDLSNMEQDFNYYLYPSEVSAYSFSILPSQTGYSTPYIRQYPCNCTGFGREYFVISTYFPGCENWTVARIEYEGTRTNISGTTSSGLEVFCTHLTLDMSGDMTGWLGDSGNTFTGNYWIVLPSCRTYIDSSDDLPDEPWVCAIHKSGSTPEIITSKWQSSIFSPGGSSAATDYADGTLSSSEVSAANTILDTSDSELTSRYPDESWDNLQIRSYNRVYDPTTGHSRDLLIFTTHDEETFEQADDVIADFEGGDLNSGLEDAEIEFVTGGIVTSSGWVSSTTSPGDGSYSVITDPVTYDIDQTLLLKLTFNKVSDGYITFLYKHHNRIWGEPGSGIGDQLFNFPVVDNYLDIKLDGALVSGDTSIGGNPQFQVNLADDDLGGTFTSVSTSRIDNLNSPEDCTGDEDKFLVWRAAKIYVEAGTHTLSFQQRRVDNANGDTLAYLYSQVDNIALGDLMVGDDTTSKRRWLFNGEKVQKAEWWAWPRRDEEAKSDLTMRVSTTPDFITLDKTGRILYGNSHYVTRLVPDPDDEGYWKLDEDFGKSRGEGHADQEGGGYVRFTASPFVTKVEVGEGSSDCGDPDPEYDYVDTVADPPWGAFQILPFGDGGDFQVRGANGTLRDATDYPFSEASFPNEYFRERTRVTNGGGWPQRPHSWTVTSDGLVLRPHVEVIWRPTKYIEAYPVEDHDGSGNPEWPHPPWQTNFASADATDHAAETWGYGALRPRDPLKLPYGSDKSRWSLTSYIVSATYSDSLSQMPQAIWKRIIDGDPTVGVDDWDPDWDPPSGNGPWPSAQWQLLLARYFPTYAGYSPVYTGPDFGLYSDEETCSTDPEVEVTTVFFRIYVTTTASGMFSIPDFDVVDRPLVCCE